MNLMCGWITTSLQCCNLRYLILKINSIEDKKYYLTVQYNIVSQEDLYRYLRNHQTMREDCLKRFGDKFRAHRRRIMKTIKTYS